jgi:hypothetical protein
MPLIDAADDRILDPLQSVLMHLPGGMYGSYQALCDYMALEPSVPESVKEGLRYVSAARVGCAFCVTVRLPGASGERLLPDAFYDAVLADRVDWDSAAPRDWAPVFRMADEVLAGGVISAATGAALKSAYTDAQIVEALFYLLLIGASHRFSRALGIEEACAVPTRLSSGVGGMLAPSSSGS